MAVKCENYPRSPNFVYRCIIVYVPIFLLLLYTRILLDIIYSYIDSKVLSLRIATLLLGKLWDE